MGNQLYTKFFEANHWWRKLFESLKFDDVHAVRFQRSRSLPDFSYSTLLCTGALYKHTTDLVMEFFFVWTQQNISSGIIHSFHSRAAIIYNFFSAKWHLRKNVSIFMPRKQEITNSDCTKLGVCFDNNGYVRIEDSSLFGLNWVKMPHWSIMCNFVGQNCSHVSAPFRCVASMIWVSIAVQNEQNAILQGLLDTILSRLWAVKIGEHLVMIDLLNKDY